MFDPLFMIGFVGLPFALNFLVGDARTNATTVPSIGACFVAVFAGYCVYVWMITTAILTFAGGFKDAQLVYLQGGSAMIAALSVGIPFILNARARKKRGSLEK